MNAVLQDREILLGVTGGIAAYKAADLCSRLVQQKARVTVIMTESAHRFIGRTTFEALTSRAVLSDPFEAHDHFQGEHIGLGQKASLMIIAPATAQSIARLAHGMADDLLSTTALVATCPILVAPAMNCDMWAKPAVQRNIEQIRRDGIFVIDPEEGWLSCGMVGVGRMAAPSTILERIEQQLALP